MKIQTASTILTIFTWLTALAAAVVIGMYLVAVAEGRTYPPPVWFSIGSGLTWLWCWAVSSAVSKMTELVDEPPD